ncbi:MAG: site-2 protease family protein [Desulfobacterales bacterium]|nr:site-2 protease family protein [Desulfobacterales bacterium]MDJ0886138.1 site-2 protease family protein [Desulfobacterales bacterium]MDJ0989058.1 site-2 protease family protein [Desulfobacterales bacterium]
MRWSIKIGRYLGIDVYMHFTFVLLISWVAFANWRQEQNVAAAATGVAFILAIFLCVVLHEFGHALTARRYGVRTRDIILLPIGGLARLERIPTQPVQELWVALAGPAVNIVIAAGLFIWLYVTATFEPLQTLTLTTGPFLERLMAVNLFLVVFNLIPAFPMDGGRVLRALLATRQDYSRATQTAAAIGQGIAVVFGFIGLLYNPFLLFIALFVWIGAAQEASMAQLKSAIGGIPVQQAMISDFRTLNINDSLDRAVALTLSGSQKDFPVVDGGRLVGILTQTDLLKALAEKDKHPTVATTIQTAYAEVDGGEMLESAFSKLRDCNCHTLPVMQADNVVGLVTMDNLGEYMRIQAAINN